MPQAENVLAAARAYGETHLTPEALTAVEIVDEPMLAGLDCESYLVRVESGPLSLALAVTVWPDGRMRVRRAAGES